MILTDISIATVTDITGVADEGEYMRANRDGYEHELVKDGGMENEALRGQRQLLRVASF